VVGYVAMALHPDFEVHDTDGVHEGSSENLVAPVQGSGVDLNVRVGRMTMTLAGKP